MALETGSRIQDLVETNPVGATDFVSQGDDHVRLIKVCVKGSFPSLGAGQVTASAEELSILDGATLSTAELNILDGVTLTAAQINDAARKTAANTFTQDQTFSALANHSAGSAAAPSITFTVDPDTGIYRSSADAISLSSGGAESHRFGGGRAYGGDGLVGSPAWSFIGDSDTGFYRSATGDVRFSADGTLSWIVRANGSFFVDGTAANPGISFIQDPDTGVYRSATDTLVFSTGGTARFGIGTATFTATLQWQGQDGSVGAPALSFSGDPDTGIYRNNTNSMSFVTGGSFGFAVNASQQVIINDGGAATPALSFNADLDTGFYRISSDAIGFSEGGAGFRVGFRNVPQNSQSANYTCVAADTGKHILHPSGGGSGDTFTIPANGSVAYDIGTVLTFVNRDSNAVSIAITTDTMYLAGSTTTGTRTLAQNGIATAIKVESTVWIISGTGLS